MGIFIASLSWIGRRNKAVLLHTLNSVVVAVAVLLLASCGVDPINNPKPLLLDTEVDYGPPEYRQGYTDGCKSALSAYASNSFIRTQQGGVHVDPRYTNNVMYNQIWKDAWNYCYMWYFVYNRQWNHSGQSPL